MPTKRGPSAGRSQSQKGILKTSKFNTSVAEEAKHGDFNFEQSAFKTNFNFNPDQSLYLES